jgi:hypothetical protein
VRPAIDIRGLVRALQRFAPPRKVAEVYEGPWLMLDMPHDVHTLPNGEAMRHELDAGCCCRPEVSKHERLLINHRVLG